MIWSHCYVGPYLLNWVVGSDEMVFGSMEFRAAGGFGIRMEARSKVTQNPSSPKSVIVRLEKSGMRYIGLEI